MKEWVWKKQEPDDYVPTLEELEMMEEAYQAWKKELDKAIASGNQEEIDELYESGK